MDNLTLETKKNMVQEFFCDVAGSRLVEWLEGAGFYTAPASISYHGAYAGGLFDHSLQVTYELMQLTEKLGLKWQRKESPAVIGMLHDVCKMDDYTVRDEMIAVKQDGGPEFEQKAAKNPEKIWPGHGEKSLIMLHGIIELTEEEMLCIRYHMGSFTDQKEWEFYTRAVEMCPNVLYTHMADMIASHIKGV